MDKKPILVTSHVSRDFLQNAAYFNSLQKVVWEYISNSLDSAEEGKYVTVVVEFHSNTILTIADDGSGMSREELSHFFQMHGENIHRKKGKRVRGRFGTGKSAAFGIAKSLKMETRHGGKRNIVRLHLDKIKKAKSGSSFPVEEILTDESVELGNGTTVEINEFMIKKFDLDKTITYVEKHLGRYRSRAKVIINDHVCEFKEPPAIKTVNVRSPNELVQHIGNVELSIKVAPFSLGKEERGIDVLSRGIWHETTLGDVESKELSDRLFGELEIPLLEDIDDDIPPFDNTRNNQLNRANPRIVILIGWISKELEKVRLEILEDEMEKRRTEQAKKLRKEAQRLAEVLNDDFDEIMQELEFARKVTGRPKSKLKELITDDGEILPGNGDQPSQFQEAGQPHGNGVAGKNPPGEGEEPRAGPDLIPGNSTGSPKKSVGEGKRKRSGLFSIEFAHHTSEFPRSKYERNTHTIFVNLDHPQVENTLKSSGGNLDSRHFLEIVYEIACVEYAQAIPFERLFQGEEVDAADVLYSVRDTIDRVTRRFTVVLLSR